MNFIGRQIGNYTIEERIGRGGMAAVYKAYQPGLDRHVAIKIMHSHLGDDEGFAERFQREARLMGRLQFPHIVRVVDAGVFHCTTDEAQNASAIQTGNGESSVLVECPSDTIYYLVLDYIEGGTLQDFLQSTHSLSIEQALDLTTQLADALVHMHDRGMIHRDIKPGNILFADESHGHALLADFGFARLVEQQVGQLTALGAIIGTPNYMSPEAVRGEPCDERSDVYSLGVVFYEMLAGRAPYVANTPYSMMMKLTSEPLPPIREFNPATPLVVEEILNKALEKDPASRFQSAAEMGDALLNARVALLGTASAATAPEINSSQETVAATAKAPKPAVTPKTQAAPRKRRLFIHRNGLTMVGSVSVVLLCAWFTIVALLILEKSVGAVGAAPVANASPLLLQTNLAILADSAKNQAQAGQTDILNGGIISAAMQAQVAEVTAASLPTVTAIENATATATPLNRLTPAQSDLPLAATDPVSNQMTVPIDAVEVVEPSTTQPVTAPPAEPVTLPAAEPVIEQTSALTTTPATHAVTAVGIPVVITPLPQK